MTDVIDTPERVGESPEAMRRRLRAVIRDRREKAGLTQKDVAERLSWSASKVVRIEQGTNLVAPSDIRALLTIFGETDSQVIEDMALLAKQARTTKGYEQFGLLKAPSREMMGLEPSARDIYKYEPSVVPGLFQTADYARGLLHGVGRSSDDIDTLIQVRLRRQEMLDDPDHPELHFIMGEAALLRPMGNAEVMNEQIDLLLKLAERPKVNVFLIPLSAGPHPGLGNAFTILQFEDATLPDLLYLENAENESIARDDEADVLRYMGIYNRIERMASEAGKFHDIVEAIRNQHYPLPVTSGG